MVPDQYFIRQPDWPREAALKWDGEWQITYETFRDMGLAYAVGILAIFLLLVAQFRAYLMPLIVMAPIALTLIGILPGHAILGQGIYRDQHDRNDRSGWNHRAQLHLAGGLYSPVA